jgi:DNA-binding NarL/FixJ family response regulator
VERSRTKVLVVDDFELFRRFISTALSIQPELQIVAEASDGLAAVQKAEELQPDLILLDIGLPKLNGIKAAERIRTLSPKSKILFVTGQFSPDLVQAALGTGASGYVVKTDGGSQLLAAVNAVLKGETFVSRSLADRGFSDFTDSQLFPEIGTTPRGKY